MHPFSALRRSAVAGLVVLVAVLGLPALPAAAVVSTVDSVSASPSPLDVTSGSAPITFTVDFTSDATYTSADFTVTPPASSGGTPQFFNAFDPAEETRTGHVVHADTWFHAASEPTGTWAVSVDVTLSSGEVVHGVGGTIDVVDNADHTGPVTDLASFSALPSAVDTTSSAARVAVSVHLADPSGVASGVVTATAPDNVTTEQAILAKTAGTATDGTFSGELALPVQSQSGAWKLSIDASDTAGNTSSVTSAQLAAAGRTPSIAVTTTVDTGSPVFGALSVSPGTVNARYGGTVSITLSATDDVSGVQTGVITLSDPSNATSTAFFGTGELTSGTTKNGTWRVPVPLGSSSATGTWRVTQLVLTDGVGHDTTVTDAALGSSRSFTVTSVVDTVAPVIGLITGPSSVDTTTGDKTVSYAVAMTDDSSGVSSVYVRLRSPSGDRYAYGYGATTTSGDALNGTWKVDVDLSKWAESGTWRIVEVSAYDNAGLFTARADSGVTLPLAVTSVQDITGPTVSGVTLTSSAPDSSGQLPVTVQVAMSDAVSGLSYANVRLRSADGTQSRSGSFGLTDGAASATVSTVVTLPAYAKPGDWRIDDIVVIDRAGNARNWTTAALHGVGIPTQLPVAGLADDTAPTLAGWAHAATVDTSASRTLPVSLSINDAASGLAFGLLRAVSPDGRTSVSTAFGPGSLTSGTTQSGSYSAALTFPAYAQAGAWQLQLSVTDQLSNTRSYPGTAFPVSAARTVTVTPLADASAPVLTDLVIAAPAIDTNSGDKTGIVDVHFTDTGSGVESVEVTVTSPSGTRTAHGYASAGALTAGGTTNNGSIPVAVRIPQWTEDGPWGITEVVLTDVAGNRAVFDKAALDATAGLDRTFTVNAGDDTVAPSLTTLALTPSTVDTTSHANDLLVTAGLTDATSGVSYARIQIASPGTPPRTYLAYLSPASGTPQSGTWTDTITLPKGSLPGTYSVTHVDVYDEAGNTRSYTPDQLPAGTTKTVNVIGTADTSAPTLSSVTVLSPSLTVSSVGKEADVRVDVADVGSGFSYGLMSLISPSGQTVITTLFDRDNLRTGNAASGSYLVSFFVPTYAESGTWRLGGLSLRDAIGNASTPVLSGSTVTVSGLSDVPGAPAYAYAQSGHTKLFLVWGDADNRGSAISDYHVEVRKVVDDSVVSAVTVGPLVRTTSVTGLTDGTSYYATIQASNGRGTGAATASGPAVPAVSPPDAPRNLGVRAGNGQVDVSWLAPSDDGGSPITGYLVLVSDTTAGGVSITPVSATTFATSVTGLVNGHAYSISVEARNSIGIGNAATASTLVTPTANTAPRLLSTTLGASLVDPVVATFTEDVTGVSPASVVLRNTPSTTAVAQAAQVCRNATGAVVACSGAVRRVELRPSTLRHVAGQKYTVAITTAVKDNQALPAVAGVSGVVRAGRVQTESTLSGAGAWSTVITASANGGSYAQSNQAGSTAEFRVSGSSVTWYATTGPRMGKADVYVDGVRKAAGLNLYSAGTTYRVAKTVSGLSNVAHTLRIVVLGQRGSTAQTGADAWVAVDAAKGSASATVQQTSPRMWRVAGSAVALNGAYASSNVVGNTYTFRFRGTGVVWQTLTGTSMGTAAVTIDGVGRPTVSAAAATTARKNVAYVGLSDALHTLTIKVTSKVIAVDGFSVA